MELKKKRDLFHTKIRRQIIYDHFKEQRKQFFQQQNFNYQQGSQEIKFQLQKDFHELIEYMEDFSDKLYKELQIGNHKNIALETKQLHYKISKIVKQLSHENRNKLIKKYFQLRLDVNLVECSLEIFEHGLKLQKEEIAIHVTAILDLIFKIMDLQHPQLNLNQLYQFLLKAIDAKWDEKHFSKLINIINNLVFLIPQTKYSILLGIGHDKCLISSICFIVSRLQIKPDGILSPKVIQLFSNYFTQMIELQSYYQKLKKEYSAQSNKLIPQKQKQNIRFKILQQNIGPFKNCLKKDHHQLILKVAIESFNHFSQTFYIYQNRQILTKSVELIKLTIQAGQIKPQKVKISYDIFMEIINSKNVSIQLKTQVLYLIDFVIYEDTKDVIAEMLVTNHLFVKYLWNIISQGYEIIIFNILSNLLLIHQCRSEVVKIMQNIVLWLTYNKILLRTKIQFVFNYFRGKKNSFQIQGQLDKLVLTLLQRNQIKQYTKQAIEQQYVIWYNLMDNGYAEGLPNKFRQMQEKNLYLQVVCNLLTAQQYFKEKNIN